MAPKIAKKERRTRWDRWHPLLVKELQLVGPGARVIALGLDAEKHLRHHRVHDVHLALHYSGNAQDHRKRAIEGREAEYAAFVETLGLDDIEAAARAVLTEGRVAEPWAGEALEELQGSTLGPGLRALAFTYKVQFEGDRPDALTARG
jgi:hypothetical protein